MTYKEKLLHPKWQKKRLEILSRDNFSCFWCGDKETTLHVHHEEYLGKNPWDTPDECLTTLCSDCHEIEHIGLNDLEKAMLDALRHRDRFQTEMIKLLNRIIRRHKGVLVE